MVLPEPGADNDVPRQLIELRAEAASTERPVPPAQLRQHRGFIKTAGEDLLLVVPVFSCGSAASGLVVFSYRRPSTWFNQAL